MCYSDSNSKKALRCHFHKKRLFLAWITLCSITLLQAQTDKDYSAYVDPFIGTEGGGHTFPGATLPYGMVKLGPDCGNLRSNPGYIPGEIIHGFSHVHVSGTGGGAKYGNILVMPFGGDFNVKGAASSPAEAVASPGYFSVRLEESDIRAELTSSHSVGFHRYTFSDPGQKGILIDAGSFLGKGHCCGEAQELVGSEVRIISDRQIEGYTRVRGGWNKGGEYTVFFTALFDTGAEYFGVWREDSVVTGGSGMYDKGDRTGAYFLFKHTPGNTIQVKVGISFISTAKAAENIRREIAHWDFQKTRQNAVRKWNEVLGSIEVGEAPAEKLKVLYTALYHTMLMPTDRSGENPKWSSGEPYYDDYYAIWDTYRATNPLLTLIQPEREKDIVCSLVDIYRYEGYMPDARSGNQNGRTQGGSNCDMVIADAWLKGLKGIDYETAFEAMVKNAGIPPGGEQEMEGRGGITEYIRLGYVPVEFEPATGSLATNMFRSYPRAGTRTVEYAANDWAIAQMARDMGKTEEYLKYRDRASNWANLWNAQIESDGAVGFIWPRNKAGEWAENFSVNKAGSWGNFFYESNSWEYSFYVPQDVRSLIDSCGGKERFISRLDTFFHNHHFQVSNEPGFFTPCLYNYAGRQDRTNSTVRKIIASYYKPTADGIPGNDDAGSMSAWVVFNLLGFFPNAGQDVYLITAPHFDRVLIDLGNNKKLEVVAHGLSEEHLFIRQVKLNGKVLDRSWFRHHEIMEGGKLEFLMSDQADNSWEKSMPPSMSGPGHKHEAY